MFLHRFWDTRGLRVFYIHSGIPEAYVFFTSILGSQRLTCFLHRFWDPRGLHVFYIYSGIPEAYMFFT